MKSYFSMSVFAKELGFTNAHEKGCMKLIRELERKNIVEIQQSGFRGDNMHHGKLVIVKDWINLLVCMDIQYESPKTIYTQKPRHVHEHPICNYQKDCRYRMKGNRCGIEIMCNQRALSTAA